MLWTVIIPTYRAREEQWNKFRKEWTPYFEKHRVNVVVMFDGAEVMDWAREPFGFVKTTVLSWTDIDNAGLQYIPKQTDMVRSYAFLWAYKNLYTEYMLTLDDDVLPQEGYDIFEEYEKVFEEGAPLSEYLNVGALTDSGVQMRGFPYKDRVKRKVAVQYGGWDNVLDYDAATQISTQPTPKMFYPINIAVPKGAAATCCIMNCAWRSEYTPIMWQLPILDGRYNRVGDIWSGLFIKKALDAADAVMVINGKASVFHDRASNVYESLKKEAPSVWLNDNLWEHLYQFETSSDLIVAYRETLLWAKMFFASHDKEYSEHFERAYEEWLREYDL